MMNMNTNPKKYELSLYLAFVAFVCVTHLSSLFVLMQPSIISFTSGMATLSKLPGFTPCTDKSRRAVKGRKGGREELKHSVVVSHQRRGEIHCEITLI